MNSYKTGLLFLLLTVSISPRAFAFDHTYQAYDSLLRDIVVEKGLQTAVDYNRLHNNPARLDEFTQNIESVSRADYDSWSADQQLAFLINAYNALTLQLIIMHYPGIESIKDTGGFFSSPWKKEFFKLLGEQSSLDHIEHDLIRQHFNEPRIHFAVNCASLSCPPLQPFAYVADKLDEQLDYATRRFLQDPERNRYIADEQRLELSSLFKWYGEDFKKAAGSIENFVAPYISDDPGTRKAITSNHTATGFLDYDWSLNDIEGL
ncbi:MAG TPA: DUF547 domain-containing protein [Gammaproteobacteria bacterium]|nr:DUF547 domain-containing protein [Gammaproteobacteria bacterium]